MGLIRVPQPYDFVLSTQRFRAYGPDLANLWHDGGLHRAVDGTDVRIEAAPHGVRVDPFDAGIEAAVRDLLGLGFDLGPFREWARSDPVLARIVTRLGGFRPMLWIDPFEAVVDCITAQQVSLWAAFAIRRRLTERFGVRVGRCYAFPTADRLADAGEEELVALGFTRRKAEYVIGLARSGVDLAALGRLPDAEVKAWICSLRGVGEWTADWFLARYLGRPEVWPAGDLSLRKAIAAFYPGLDDVRTAGRRFAPFQNLTAQFLLLALTQRPRPPRKRAG